MKEPWIYVDLDDVLCQTSRALTDLHAARTGRRLGIEDVHSFDLRISLALDEAEYVAFMRAAHEAAFLESMLPFEEASAQLAAWSAQGYRIAVLTGRPASCEASTRRWLQSHALTHHALHMVDKYGRLDWHDEAQRAMSLEEMRALRFEVALEDSLPMAEFLAGTMRVPVLLLERPWNRAAPSPAARPLITRVADLADAARQLARIRQRSGS